MAKSSFELKILYAEAEEAVLAEQAQAIKKAGHHVTTASDRKSVEQTLKQDAFDLVILGGTLSRNDRHHLPYMVKKHHQGTRVLVLHTDGGRHPYVDANLDTGSQVEALLGKIAASFAGAAASR